MNDPATIGDPSIGDPPSPPSSAEDVASTRQCGRCRLHFPVDAGTHPMELRDWWACPACADTLLPGRAAAAATR